jgi:predicted ATP-dependent serine protease
VQVDGRVAEAAKLGFGAFVLPAGNRRTIDGRHTIALSGVANVTEAINAIL